jgi:hypothetical protein
LNDFFVSVFVTTCLFKNIQGPEVILAMVSGTSSWLAFMNSSAPKEWPWAELIAALQQQD